MEKEMKVVVQGTNEFDEYSVFLRSMGVMMSGLKETDHEFIVYSLGPSNVNDFADDDDDDDDGSFIATCLSSVYISIILLQPIYNNNIKLSLIIIIIIIIIMMIDNN
jgi:hypothetical protein